MVIIAHKGDPEKALHQQKEFYEILGRAISQWANLEDQIYHTFRMVIEPRDVAAAAAAFHAILNQNTRLDMIGAGLSVSSKFGHRLPDWESLRKKIRKQAARRAKLAHWTVVQDATQPGETGVTMLLSPPFYDFASPHDDDGNRPRILGNQIAEWSNSFASLSGEIENFWRQLA